MPQQLNIKKQLAESGGGIYINRWWTGLVTNRSPLFVPVSSLGLQIISRHDSLYDGQNVEVSPQLTLIRRPGFPRYCSIALGAEKPLAYFSFKNTSGTIRTMVDTTLRVATFTSSAITSLYTKGTTAQTSFCKVGDALYMYDGTNAKRWDGTNLNNIGVVAPATAPTISLGGTGFTLKSGRKYVYCYKRSATGEISTASTSSASTLAFTNKTVTVGGACSGDGTVDKVQIYATDDGGSLFYFLAEVTNTGPSWTYNDTTPDTGLNDDIVAPTAHLNDPPPAGASLACFHMGRVWVAAGNKLYFGGGPQITNGVPECCFPPANVFTLPGKITAMVSTSGGLAVWTQDDFYVVLGSDLSNFYPKKYQSNFGVFSQNCVAQDGDLLFVLTSTGQLFTFSDSLEEVGFSIRNKISTINPASAYMTLHRSGTDEGLFISDGSTTMYRYSVAQKAWSTPAPITGGVGCINSIEVSTASYKLLAGRAANAGYILNRSLAAFNDDGTTYTAYATVGTIMLAPPGQISVLRDVMLETQPIGTYPTVSVLLNEVGGSFTALPNPVPEPPMLPASSTVIAKRHYFKSAATPLPQQVRFLSVKIALAAEDAANEILGLALGAE